MAKACGIRIGPRRYELVVLEGSPKRPKIAAWTAGELPPGGLSDPAQVGRALGEAARAQGAPKEAIGIAMEARQAAFRQLQLPLSDPEKIEQVIKYEVESQLPQFNIDDVVVDFHVLDAAEDASNLLATAVPKEPIRRVIEACEAGGLQPHEVELETSALVNAAVGAGACPDGSAQVLVHVGEETTSVVTVDGGKVREMRVIQIGALSHLPRPAAPREEDEENGGSAADEENPEGAAAEETPELSPAEQRRKLEQNLQRIRRELSRTVTGARTTHAIDAVLVCGLSLPGFPGGEVQGVPVRALRVESEGEDVPEGDPVPVIAYGAALRELGGGRLKASLRREELRYTGTFERLELPLAVASLLLVTLLGVWNIFIDKDIRAVSLALEGWWNGSRNFMLTDLERGTQGNLEFPSERLKRYVAAVDAGEDPDFTNHYDALVRVKAMIASEIREMQKQLGRDTELERPQSAFKAATLVLGLFEDAESLGIRPSLRQVRATYQKATRGQPERVRVTLDLTIFADSATAARAGYESILQRFLEKPWGLDVERRQTSALDGDKGIAIQGLGFIVDVSKVQSEEDWS